MTFNEICNDYVLLVIIILYLLKRHCKVVHISIVKANGLSHTHWQAKSSAQTQSPIGMRRIKPLHLFWKRIAFFNMFIKNIHVSLCSINLWLEIGPGKKCIWKRICQIHQIRWIKYKYKYKYTVWNLIKYKYKYKYAVFVFVFVFANTNTYLTPALLISVISLYWKNVRRLTFFCTILWRQCDVILTWFCWYVLRLWCYIAFVYDL